MQIKKLVCGSAKNITVFATRRNLSVDTVNKILRRFGHMLTISLITYLFCFHDLTLASYSN